MHHHNFRSITKIARNIGWAISLASLLLSGKPTQAQVNLSPLLIDVDAKADKARGVIDIRNSSDNEFRARIYAEPFTYDRNYGFKTLTASPTDIRPYLQFSPQEVSLPKGGLRRVRMTVNLPPNLPDGEYRAMIFTEPLVDFSTSNGEANGTKIVNRIGTAFYVRKGNIQPNLKIDSLTWNRETNQLQLLVHNSGKASAQTTATWSAKQGGKVVRTGNSLFTTVIAEGDRQLFLQTSPSDSAPLAPGTYEVSGTLTARQGKKTAQSFNFQVKVLPSNGLLSKP